MKRPVQHETDAAGQRLLRAAFEGFGWVVNGIENDYGADYEVEIFEEGLSTGATFKVQLKSSASTHYSSDGTVVSQPIRVANAKYLTHELRIPTAVVHCDVTAGRTYWLLPQLDASVVGRLDTLNDDQSITLHLPVINELPASKTSFVEALQRADAALSVRAARRVPPTLVAQLGEQILGTDTEATIRAFQAHSDALRLAEAYSRTVAGDLDKTFKLISELLEAPGSAVEHKFRAWLIWEMAELNRHIATGFSDRSRVETSNRVARQLRALTKDGPTHLKYYSAVNALAVRVSELAHDGHAMGMAERFASDARPVFTLSRQQLDRRLDLTLRRSARIVNRLLQTSHAWVLPMALSRLAMSIGIACLRFEHEERRDAAQSLKTYGLDLCRTAVRIAGALGDQTALASAASSALVLSKSDSDDAMTFAIEIAGRITAPAEQAFVANALDKSRRMHKGERVEGKIKTTTRQIAENIEDGLRLAQQHRPPTTGASQPES
ncbi:MAG: DUF4365 domain-containing protein [Vicinamibacterales bacterium]